jgi:hypothetical protein
MKILNLTVAIIYSMIYFFVLLISIAEGDVDLFLGILIWSGPLVVNWVTYSQLK